MNILITSVGRRSYMVDYFRNALNGNGKIFAANSEMTYALTKADEYILTPTIYDSSYIQFLLDYCKQNRINTLISLFDIDLPILSKNRTAFEELGVKMLVSDFAFVSTCNDKWKSYKFITNNGFDAPATYLTIERAKEAIEINEIQYPLIIKPRWGMGSIGIYEAENEEELELFYKKTKNAILKSYLRYESRESIDESVIIQEKVSGQEWGLDIFNDLSGNFLACVPKQKLAMRAGETDVARTSLDKDLISFGQDISKITGHIGNLDMDFFIMGNKFYILEFNCRFGGQYPFSHTAGVDFTKALLAMVNNENVPMEYFTFDECLAFKDLEIRKI